MSAPMRTDSTVLSPVKEALACAELLDVRAVAATLSCSPRHVIRLSEAGRMPAPIRLGTLLRWNRALIEQWIAAGCPRADVSAR